MVGGNRSPLRSFSFVVFKAGINVVYAELREDAKPLFINPVGARRQVVVIMLDAASEGLNGIDDYDGGGDDCDYRESRL